jgi:hypothetical protein
MGVDQLECPTTDVYLINDDGKPLASRGLPEGLDGIRMLRELVADHIARSG